MQQGDDGNWDRRKLLKMMGSGGIVTTTSILAGCSGGGQSSGGSEGSSNQSQSTAGSSNQSQSTAGSSNQSQSTAGSSNQSQSTAPSERQSGGTVNVGLPTDVRTLNPHKARQTSSLRLAKNYGNRLLEVTPEGEIYADLAKEVPKPQNNNKKFVFQLKSGVQYHGDYGEMTAEDVVYNMRKIVDADYGSPGRSSFINTLVGDNTDPKNTIQATGENEVTFNLDRPDAGFRYKMTNARMSIIPPKALEEHGTNFGNIDVGTWATGPFQYSKGSTGSSYTFSKFPEYFKKDSDNNQLPYLDEVTFTISPSPSTRTTQVRTGGLDIATSIPPRNTKSLRNAEGVELNSRPSGTELNMFPNQRTYKPFTKKKMRQALAYGANQEAIVQSVLNGEATPMQTLFPPWHWAHNSDAVKKYPHDPEKAKQLVEEAGESNLQFNCSPTNQPIFTDTATILQQNYRQIGLKMEITPKSKSVSWTPTVNAWDPEKFEPKDEVGPPSSFESLIEDIGEYYAAGTYAWRLFHTGAPLNRSYYSNDNVDKWLEQARSETNREKRKELYTKIQKQVAEDMPQIFLAWENVIQAYKTNIHNLPIYPTGTLKLETTWKEN